MLVLCEKFQLVQNVPVLIRVMNVGGTFFIGLGDFKFKEKSL